MALLLDTCILLWILEDSSKLTDKSKKLLAESIPCFVSAVSIVEIEIKRSIGKLTLSDDYREAIEHSGIKELAYTYHDSLNLNTLPIHHRDPCDRMLISQAIERGLTILTDDIHFNPYPVKVLQNRS